MNFINHIKALLVIQISFVSCLFAQNTSYNIQIQIEGLKDTSIYLASHWGNKKLSIDTTKLNNKGSGVFQGQNKLPEGIYLIVLPDKSSFEFLIDKDQDFQIKTSVPNPDKNLSIKESDENTLFIDYQKYMFDYNSKKKSLNNKIKKNTNDKHLKKSLQKLEDDFENHKNSLIAKHPNSLTTKIIKGFSSPLIPDSLKKGTHEAYIYYKQHYFDNIDFSDSCLIRSPILENKYNTYFNHLVIQIPDSLSKEAINLIEKTKSNNELFKYTANHLLEFFEKKRNPIMEIIFVDISEKYFLSKEIELPEKTYQKLKRKINRLKPNLIGNTAPDLEKLPTYGNEFESLHLIKADYTLLTFWEPNCGHCKITIPKLHKVYEKYQDKSIKVMAFYTQTDTTQWKKFIEKKELTDWINVYDPYYHSGFREKYNINTTPIIYLLDKEKKILFKEISPEQAELFFERIFGIKTEK